jgi:hypothetical protein
MAGDALRAAHLTTRAPSPGSLREGLPPGLNSLTASMLDKNPDARPTAVQVYNALLPFIADSPAITLPLAAALPRARPGCALGPVSGPGRPHRRRSIGRHPIGTFSNAPTRPTWPTPKPDKNPAEFLQILQTRFIIAQVRNLDKQARRLGS